MNESLELTNTEFNNRENNVSHLPYDREMAFYKAIKNGDMGTTMALFTPLCTQGFGKLSDNKLRNLKYHLIITVAFITRYCIEGGLEMETAYNLSDIYILKIDRSDTEEEVREIHKELVQAYVKRMQALKHRKLYSKPVTACIDYIYDNLHSKINLEDLADVSGLSEAYLSKLFHKEVGKTTSQYITEKKIESAKNILAFTDNSSADISNYLCFSSESHFISVFKKITGVTPKEYKKQHFREKDRSINGQ